MRIGLLFIFFIFFISGVSAISWSGGGTTTVNGTVSYENLAFTNQSNSFTGNQSTSGWFKGLFNFTAVFLSKYVIGDFDGSTLNIDFNETFNNETIDDRIDLKGGDLNYTNYLGSDFSGSDMEINRTLVIGIDVAIVSMERQTLHPEIDYEITGGELKIFRNVFDVFRITVTNKGSLVYTNLQGSDLSGTNPNKSFSVATTPELIILERQTLRPGSDYNYNGTDINFNIQIEDVMRITIWN